MQTLEPVTNNAQTVQAPGNYTRSPVRLDRARRGKTRVHVLYPSHNAHHTVRAGRRALKNGRYFNRRLELDVPLDPGMDWNGGGDIYIDGDRGVQTTYTGLAGWLGIDGRYAYAADFRKDARDLRTRGMQFEKFLWPLAVIVAIAVFGPIILIVLTQG